MVDMIIPNSILNTDNIWVSIIAWVGALVFGAILAVICALIESKKDKKDDK